MSCIIHYSSEDNNAPLIEPTDVESWKSLYRAAVTRDHKVLLTKASNVQGDEVPTGILYHRKCRSRFTMKRDLLALSPKTNETEAPAAKRRSIRDRDSESSTVYDRKCMFCGKTNKYKKYKRTRESLLLCDQMRVDNRVREVAQRKGDSKMLALASRELVAAEAMYHHSCYKDYTRPQHVDTPIETTGAYKIAEDKAFSKLFEFIRNDLFKNSRVITMTTLTEKLHLYLQELDVEDIKESTSTHIRRKLLAEFGESLHVTQTSSYKLLVFPHTLSVEMLAEQYQTLQNELDNFKADVSNANSVISKAASFIYSSIRDSESLAYNEEWPPEPSKMTKENVIIPSSLDLFLKKLLSGNDDNASSRVSWIANSLSQDIIYSVTKGRVVPPKHLSLPSAVKSLTGNVELITLLNRLGHSISYTKLSEIETALCLRKLAVYKGNTPLPENINPHINATVAFDNIDRNEETLSGSGTSHRVNGIIVQPRVFGPQVKREKPIIIKTKQRSLVSFIDDYHLSTYNAGERKGPPLASSPVELDYTEVLQTAHKQNLLWLLCREQNFKSQRIPSWTGFNHLVTNFENNTPNTMGYLPSINAPATNLSTVYEMLSQCNKIRDNLKIDKIICVLDQALYSKACEIKWKNVDEFSNVVLRMGTFHTICTLLAIIGKRFKDAGLRDLCIETGILSEGSVTAALEGRMYNRGVRMHKIVYEALYRILWKSFLVWLKSTREDDATHVEIVDSVIEKLCEDLESETFSESLNNDDIVKVSSLFDMYISVLRNKKDTLASFWLSYLDLVELLLHLIRASREQNWSLHLAAVREMIPWCFAYDRLNYAKYLPIYYQDMVNLERDDPKIFEYLKEGGFTVKLGQSASGFGSIPVDQALEETVNRDTQTAGGTKGFSLKPAAIHKYYINAEYRTILLRNIRDMVDFNSTSQHDDLGLARIIKDEQDVSAVVELIEKDWINPFENNGQDLCSLSTGASPSAEIIKDLTNAKEIGEKKYNNFVEKRLNLGESGFFDRVGKENLKTFSDIRKKQKNVKVKGKEEIVKADKNLFARMVITAQCRQLDMEQVLSHPLGPLPWALATPDGYLRKTNKSTLGTELEKTTPLAESYPSPSACIIDGMAFVNKIYGDKKAFGVISNILFNTIIKEAGTSERIDVIFDEYATISIKSVEREMRKGDVDCIQYKEILDTASVANWGNFLKSSANKTKLLSFFVNQWQTAKYTNKLTAYNKILYVTLKEKCFRIQSAETIEVPELRSTHEEADTRILLHARHIPNNHFKSIVISSADTDVRILLLAFSNKISVPMFQKCGSVTRTKFVDISAMAQALGTDVCEALPGLHAFTGCDSVSAFAGKGKRSGLNILKRDKYFQKVFYDLGRDWELSQELIEGLEKFTCMLYGAKNGESNVNQFRYHYFCAKKGEIESHQLPPCKNSLSKHAQRANYQTAVWRASLVGEPNIPSPVGKGWVLDAHMLQFDWIEGDPAPLAVLELMACKCRKTCKPECVCIQNNLPCTQMCHNYACSNMQQEKEVKMVEEKDEDLDY